MNGKRAEPSADRRRLLEERAANQQRTVRAAASNLLVSARDIAGTPHGDDGLLGGRAYLINQWRKRSASTRSANGPFPAPVTAGRSPQYNAGEVLDWLDRERDRHHQTPSEFDIAEPTPAWFWRRSVAALPAATPVDQRENLRAFVTALVATGAATHGLLGKVTAPASNPELAGRIEALRNQAAKAETANPSMAGALSEGLAAATPDSTIVSALAASLDSALIEWQLNGSPGHAPADLLDTALDILTDLSPDAPATQRELTDWTTALVEHWQPTSVLDPACGEAWVLSQLAARTPQTPTIIGIEIEPSPASTARVRLALRGIDAQIATASALAPHAVPPAAVDVVVLDPPVVKRKQGEGIGRWIKLAEDAPGSNGRAVIAMPASALQKNAAASDALRRRVISAVVVLPASVRHGARDPQALTILTKAGGREELLIIDARNLKNLERDGTGSGGQAAQNAVADVITGWLDHRDTTERDLQHLLAHHHITGRVIDTHEVILGGVLTWTSIKPPEAIRDAVANLQELLTRTPGLAGASRLEDALRAFAKANYLPDPNTPQQPLTDPLHVPDSSE